MNDYMPESPKRESSKDKNSFNLRINLFFFSTFLIFCIIIIRLAILQFVEGPMLTEKETRNNVKDVPLEPTRGSIISADGYKLAYSVPTRSLYVTLMENYSNPDSENYAKIESIAEDLVAAFNEYGDKSQEPMTKEDVIDAMDLTYRKYNGYTPRRIKIDLTDQEVAFFMEHKSDFPGIDIVEESIREYDKDTVAVQTIGYTKDFNKAQSLDKYSSIMEAMKNGTNVDSGLMYVDSEVVGVDGLEYMYQDELRGKNGYKRIPVDPRNMPEEVSEIVPPEKGYDLHTTINKEIQLTTEQAITDQIKWLHTHPVTGRLHPNALTGYAVAMEVKTGNIVAMASMPDYDTNVWRDGIKTEDWNKIINNYQNGTITPISSGRSGNNLDSAVLLGSTIKPLTVLIGLNEGFFSPSTIYQDRGIAYFGKEGHQTSVKNSQSHVYGSMNAARAIEKSSNAFMVDMIGKPLYSKYGSGAIDVWDRYMKQFGLGVLTEIGLPFEYKGLLEYTKIEQAGSAQAAMVYASFGQQGKYTTMQLAQYAATIANKGKRLKPQLVNKMTDADGQVVKEFEPEVLNEINFNDAYWNAVIKGMSSSVSAFGDFPYDFARKTGTSQSQVKGKLVDNGVFIAFAPRENPVLAVAVMIPEGGFGSSSAAPIARKIFDAYDQVYGLDGVPKGATDEGEAGAEPAADGE